MPELSDYNETTKNSLEFRASIIPYDACEDPNSPILASSGDNINLIFNIPKESFRNLALAAIAHLGSNSGFENTGTSNDKESNKKSSSSLKSKFRLSDVIKNLENDNAKDVIDAYEEDSHKSANSNYDETSADPKSCVNGNGSFVVGKEFVPNDYDAEHSQNVKMAKKFQESNDLKISVLEKNTDASRKLSDLESVLNVTTNGKCGEPEHSDMDRIDENSLKYENNDILNEKEIDCEKNKDYHNKFEHKILENPEQHVVDKEQICGNEDARVDIFSDHRLDLSDCPELESAWPDIHPFTETEKIPIEEMKSLELNGFLTKYLKLELSNEFVIIKVTSESNVLVDAVKYKEKEKESTLETKGNSEDYKADEDGSESECLVIDADVSLALPTVVSNMNVHSMAEIVSLGDNASEKRENNLPVDVPHTVPEVPFISNAESETSEPENKMEPPAPNASSLPDFSNLVTETANSLSKNEFIDSPELDSSDKFLEKTKLERISRKIEEVLKESTSIPGSSPTRRVKTAFKESLGCFSSEVDVKAQAEESVADISQVLSENSVFKENASQSDFQVQEQCLEDSLEKCIAESSETVDSNGIAEVHVEKESQKHDKISPEKKPTEDLSNKNESENFKYSNEAEKLELNDSFKSENILSNVEATNIVEKSFVPIEDKDSLEDSALGNDLHLSESEVLSDNRKSEDLEYKKDSQEMSERNSCKIKENENMESNENAISCPSIDNDAQGKQGDKASEENCQAEMIESTKLENFENSLTESVTEEQYKQTNVSLDKTSAENIQEENNAEFKRESNELTITKGELKTENIPELTLKKYTNVEETLNAAFDPDEIGEAYTKSFEKESLERSSEYLDSVLKTTDIEEKLAENSSDGNMVSFMNTTVDVNVESASEYGDIESDDKSVASESDDSKDSFKSDKQASLKNDSKRIRDIDEIDCAPTRTRRKARFGLSKDVIPENTQVNSTKLSNSQSLASPSKYSGRTSPIARSLRSKSLDPTPQPSKGNVHDKKHSTVESEEPTRKTRAKTPDIIGKKDLKITARSSPRKLGRSSAAPEPNSASKVQSIKNNVADSKSRANLDFSEPTKRSKRGSKE